MARCWLAYPESTPDCHAEWKSTIHASVVTVQHWVDLEGRHSLVLPKRRVPVDHGDTAS